MTDPIDTERIKSVLPELKWTLMEKEKEVRGQNYNYYYIFNISKYLSGKIFCAPNEIIRTLEEDKEKRHFRPENAKEVRGKWLVKIISRRGKKKKSYYYTSGSTGKTNKIDPALNVKKAIQAHLSAILINLRDSGLDDHAEEIKEFCKELRQREMR